MKPLDEHVPPSDQSPFSWLDLIPLGMCVIDGDLRVRAWNDRLAQWTGLTFSDLEKTDLGTRFPRLRLPRYYDRLLHVLESGTPTVFSAALHRQVLEVPARSGTPGELMIQETWVRRIVADQPLLLLAIQDLTSEYHQLRALRKDRRELIQTKEELELVNHSLQSSLGMYARNNQRLQVEVQERARIEDELRKQASDLTIAKDREAENAVWLEQLVKDLTTAREQAESAARSKSEFLANMSHEIRTPMTAILGYVDLLREPEMTEDERNQAMETIHRNGQHLLAIINDILDISKIEAGRMTVERLSCSPHALIGEMIELMSPRAVEKKLSLTADFIGPIPDSVQTDPTRVRQILVNLIGNALKFTSSGSVRIVTQMVTAPEAGKARLRIDVIDTGIGMSARQIQSLFQPFTQADMTMTRQFGGTGLGLAISRRLAGMLGGDITIASEPDRGSCFTVTLDPGEYVMRCRTGNATAEKLLAAAPALSPVAKPLANTHVLIADDAPDNRKLLSFHLNKAGATFDLAENGEIAVQKIRERRILRPYDAVLLDMQMPILDGYGAARTIREDGNQVPLIALTAHAMTGDREKCLSAGCDDFLTKPIDRVALIETLVNYAVRPQQMLSVFP